MIYIPYYNALALPDVSCYFQLDYLNGQSDQPVSAGDKVLFLMLKNEKQEGENEAEDIFPSPSGAWWRASTISGRWFTPPTG